VGNVELKILSAIKIDPKFRVPLTEATTRSKIPNDMIKTFPVMDMRCCALMINANPNRISKTQGMNTW